MTISEYLEVTGTTRREFAERVGVSEAFLSRLVARKRTPSFDMAIKIIDVTKKAVSVEDMTAINADLEDCAPAQGAA